MTICAVAMVSLLLRTALVSLTSLSTALLERMLMAPLTVAPGDTVMLCAMLCVTPSLSVTVSSTLNVPLRNVWEMVVPTPELLSSKFHV